MPLSSVRMILLCTVLVVAARADVTLRYSLEVRPGAMMPPQAADQMKAQLAKQMPETSMMMRLKGNRAISSFMGVQAISDFDGVMVTLLDSKSKRFATVAASEYMRVSVENQKRAHKDMPPEARRAMEEMKFDVESRVTDRTSTIRGIAAQERELTITIEAPGAAGAMRGVVSVWVPRAEELERNAALRELAAYSARAYVGTNVMEHLQQMFAQAPGFGSGMAKLAQDFKDVGMMLGLRFSMYVPGMAEMMAKMAAARGEKPPEGFDPKAPTVEILFNLDELSMESVPDSAFVVPRDYTAVGIEEMMKAVTPEPPKAPAAKDAR